MKHVAVIIRATELDRIREALRGAIGLSLRGDRLTVVTVACAGEDPAIDRALATLDMLGHRVIRDPQRAGDVIHRADAIEVWT